jgi:hypothetical protein
MAVSQDGVPWPEKINVDGNSATHRGLRLLAAEDRRWQDVEVRARRYLNNVVEQDHRAIKQRCAPMLGLKSFRSAATTLAGIELAHRIRKQQYSVPSGANGRTRSLKDSWTAALAGSAGLMCRRRAMFANAPELSTGLKWPRERPRHRWAGSIPAQDLLRRKSVSARSAPGRAVLALPLSVRRQAKDAFARDLSRTSLSPGRRSRHRAARRLLAAGVDPSLCGLRIVRKSHLW